MRIPKQIKRKELSLLRKYYKRKRFRPDIVIFILGLEWFGFPKKFLKTKRIDDQSLSVLNPDALGMDWVICDDGFNWFFGGVGNKKVFIEHIEAGTMASGRILRTLLAYEPKISFALGFCGSRKEHKPGDLILCKKTFGDWPANKYWLGKHVPVVMPNRIDKLFPKSIKRGNIYSVSDLFFEKEIIKEHKDYDFVDMETYIYYTISKAIDIPYSTLFVVSDNIKKESIISAERLKKKEFLRKKLKESFEIIINICKNLDI